MFKMVHMRSEKPICAPPSLSEVSSTLPLTQFNVRLIDCVPSTGRVHERKAEVLKKILKAPDNHRGHIRYTQWVCNLENLLLEEVDDKDICKTLLSMAEVLIVSNNNGCSTDNGCYLLQRKSLKTLVRFRKVQFSSAQLISVQFKMVFMRWAKPTICMRSTPSLTICPSF